MALDRKSVLVGAGVTTVAVVVTMMIATTAGASWWPFGHHDQPTMTVSLRGELDCSEVLGTGFGASPAKFTISAGTDSQSWTYPFKLGTSGIFHPPNFEYYQFAVTIPKNQGSIHVSWKLSCWDQAGSMGSATSDSFDVNRDGTTATRTICYKTPGISFCPGSRLETVALNCLVGLVIPGKALEVLDGASVIQGDKKATYASIISKLVPENSKKAVGVIFACTDGDPLRDQRPVPSTPTPVNKLPPLNANPATPVAPMTSAPKPPVVAPPNPAPPQPVDRTAIVSYNRMSGGAPYWGRATKGWQAFTANSNTLTQVGVTWSDTNYAGGAVLSGITTRISVCQGVGSPSSADPCSGRIADGYATVVNQGDTRLDLGDVAVTPGTTYYVFYYQPTVNAGSWDFYWWSCSCSPGRNSSLLSDQNQLIVVGYNR